MRNFKRSCCALLSVLFLTLSPAACGNPKEEPASSTVSSPSPAGYGGAGRTAENLPEAAPLSDEDGEPEADEELLTEEEAPLLTVKTAVETPLLKSRGKGGALATLPAGQVLEIADEGRVLWFEAELEDGTTGYLYGEDLLLVTEDGTVSDTDLTRQRVDAKLKALQIEFPGGKYWNHMGTEIEFGEETPFSVTDTPCEHSVYGEAYCNVYNGKTLALFPEYGYLCQCLGFAGLLSDQVFGERAPVYFFYDYDQLRPGDQIRLNEYEHSMIVVQKTDEFVTVAEVNEDYEDCLISWDRQISRYELEYELSWDLEYISRYPMWRDGDGNLLTRDEVAGRRDDG